MGFKFQRCNTVFPVHVVDNVLYVHICDGVMYRTKCPIGMDLPLQQNAFTGRGVAFYLRDDTHQWVGRNDGSLSIYSAAENLLLDVRAWGPAPYTFVTGAHTSEQITYEDLFCIEHMDNIILPSVDRAVIKLDEPIHMVTHPGDFGCQPIVDKYIVSTAGGMRDAVKNGLHRQAIPQGTGTYILG